MKKDTNLTQEEESIRLDKWLWAARFFKTRTICKNAITNGKILINNERPKSSRKVKINEEITITQPHTAITVLILKLSANRGPAIEAQMLYKETKDSIKRRDLEKQKNSSINSFNDKNIKKPSKKTDRRALANIKRNNQ